VARTYVVTGSTSGIGRAVRRALEAQGHRVIGVDLRDAEVTADLTTAGGRAALRQIDRVDAVITCAGVSAAGATPETIVRLNYFGTVATLERLYPRLVQGSDPRAVVVTSAAALFPTDEALVEACLAGDEERAVALCGDDGEGVRTYSSTKRALARWVRRAAPGEAWAGKGIPLNAVAPGVIRTPMTRARLDDPVLRGQMMSALSMPLRWPGEPEDVASLLVYLAGPTNTLVTGQHVFVDGGFEAWARGDRY
jgi:NAD(P)-dependent dehydrogenase (short-subunit alcohol dehydrogenase family)